MGSISFAAGFIPPKSYSTPTKKADSSNTKPTRDIEAPVVSTANYVDNQQTTDADIDFIQNMLKQDGYNMADLNNSREYSNPFC